MAAFEYFELEDAPVVVEQASDIGWTWSRGAWRSEEGLAHRCFLTGIRLNRDAFVQKHPYAAIELLELPNPKDPRNGRPPVQG